MVAGPGSTPASCPTGRRAAGHPGRLGPRGVVAYNEAAQAASLGNVEASPSLVYGARLLSGFGADTPIARSNRAASAKRR